MRNWIEFRSVIRIALLAPKSNVVSHGPSKMRRPIVPMVPAAGKVNTCPENGAEPSGATARPSEPIADEDTKKAPLPVMRNWNTPRNWLSVSAEFMVLPWFDCTLLWRLKVPRPEYTLKFSPDWRLNTPEITQPESTN